MEKTNDNILEKSQIHNQKLYKVYKMFSWDLICFYAISYLFLSQEKGLSTSQIIFAEAFYPLFKLIFQVPCTILIEKLGKRNSIVLANFFLIIYILIIMGLQSTFGYVVANIICAFGYIIKNIAESNILFDSLPNNEEKRIKFSKIDGKGLAWYYYFDAITAFCSGFLFVLNPYLPMFICLTCLIISLILSCNFISINAIKNTTNEKSTSFKHYVTDLKQAFKFIANSNRLRALIIFNAAFSTLIYILSTLTKSLLKEISIPDEYFGILSTIWALVAGFSANSASRIHKNHRNHTLEYLSLIYISCIILVGTISVLSGLPPFFVYFSILLLITIQYSVKSPFLTLIQRYLGSFSTSKMQTRISSANILIESLARMIFSFIVSYLTTNLSSSATTLIIGISFAILLIAILKYMKTRVGLKPEEYSNSDIKFNEVY